MGDDLFDDFEKPSIASFSEVQDSQHDLKEMYVYYEKNLGHCVVASLQDNIFDFDGSYFSAIMLLFYYNICLYKLI